MLEFIADNIILFVALILLLFLIINLESKQLFGKVKPISNDGLTKLLNNNKITLNLALNYGSKEEIVNVCKKLIIKKNKKVNIDNFENELYTKNIPDPEILIRTGNTQRLSNFLLWQAAYTEIFFVKKLWPDFKYEDLNKIIKKFSNIKRNFGKI